MKLTTINDGIEGGNVVGRGAERAFRLIRQDSKLQIKLWSTNITGSLIKLVQIFNSIQ